MLIEEATCSLILSNSRVHPFRNFSLEACRLMPYFRAAVLAPCRVFESSNIAILPLVSPMYGLGLQGQKAQPTLAKDPRFVNRYRRLTVYDVLWGSCYDLLAPLSVAVPMLSAGKPVPHLRPCFHPQNWQSGEATGLIKTTIVPSPVVLPDGVNLLYLRNELFVRYQENVYYFTLDLPFL